jgi:flagellar export protein FliJ
MKKFRFKLDVLEKVRKTQENERLRALAEAQSLFRDCVDKKNSLLAELNQALIRRENLGSHAVGINQYLAEEDFILGTKYRIVQADHQIMAAKKKVDKALRSYFEARRQTRKIEVIREKQWGEYKIEVAKQERKDLDDLYIMRSRIGKDVA